MKKIIIFYIFLTFLLSQSNQRDYALKFDGDVSLTIYNMLGQKVKSFDMQGIQAGKHTLRWNATNDLGDPVGAGVYLYQLHTKDFVKTRKMVLLK